MSDKELSHWTSSSFQDSIWWLSRCSLIFFQWEMASFYHSLGTSVAHCQRVAVFWNCFLWAGLGIMNKIFLANIPNLNSISEVFLFMLHLFSLSYTVGTLVYRNSEDWRCQPQLLIWSVLGVRHSQYVSVLPLYRFLKTILKCSLPSPWTPYVCCSGSSSFPQGEIVYHWQFPRIKHWFDFRLYWNNCNVVRCDAGLLDKFRSSRNY